MAEPFVQHINSSSSTPVANSAAAASLFRSMADQQIVLQIGQLSSSTPPPPPDDEQRKSAHHGTLNLRVTEPILLHINSLTPLLNNQPISTQSRPTPPPPKDQVTSNPTTDIAQSLKGTKHQKALSKMGSLANLLPTGTVLAFQAITPSLSYNGRCHIFNKYLVAFVMLACSLVCFVSSFTDSLEYEQKVYYGIATFNGLSVFNYERREVEEKALEDKLKSLKIIPRDYLHAFLSVFVFLIFACSSLEVQTCYFPAGIRDQLEYSMVIYLPLVVGLLSSFLFTHFPTNRRGIGYTCTRT
ncbi:protein DMP10-like [Rosa rugosa]|uniref:protein DMP10-like n=1 Tax=Rosa rugosa TaxID=74645 RepID=UPI002B407DD6|nr:protein DMP10-like [Rosa rugosa]